MSDRFTPSGEWEQLDLPDADVALLRGLALPADCMARLVAECDWRQDAIRLYGREMLQPRLHAWYGDAHAVYTYSGLRNVPLPWTPLLAELRGIVERAAGARFNSVLLNLYRDGRDSMGMHSDDEAELGPQPVIASLSLGATRTFILRHRREKALKPVRVPLGDGDLLVMRGETQANWAHGINKQAQAGARLNLTLRLINTRKDVTNAVNR